MVTKADVAWFKGVYGAEMAAAVKGTCFEVDHLVAIACQETGYIWSVLRKDASLSPAQIAALCCGDTLDADRGRSAFPKTADDLIAASNGKAMFDIARQAIGDLADHVPGFGFVKTNPRKFAHGFGIWQYDIQFFRDDPSYFLERRYEKVSESARKALVELAYALRKLGLSGATKISDADAVKCFIIYNTGRYVPDRGLKQGFRDDDGKYYGEAINDYLALVRSVPSAPVLVPPPASPAPATPAQGKSWLSVLLAALGLGGSSAAAFGVSIEVIVGVAIASAIVVGIGYLVLKSKGIVK